MALLPESMMNPESTDDEHLSAVELAAYLDRRVAAAARQRLEAHLADCDACREEVVEVAHILRSPTRLPVRRLAAGAAGLAAAALAAFLVLSSPPEEAEPTRLPVLRGERVATEGTPILGTVAPGEGERVDPTTLVFEWRSAGENAFYRLTLTDERGDGVWSGGTSDTTLPLAAGAALEPSAVYFWYVDALLADGASATTGVHRFRTAP